MKYDCSLLDAIIITSSIALSSGTPLSDMQQEAMRMLPDDRELSRMLVMETYRTDNVEDYREHIAKTCLFVNNHPSNRKYIEDRD